MATANAVAPSGNSPLLRAEPVHAVPTEANPDPLVKRPLPPALLNVLHLVEDLFNEGTMGLDDDWRATVRLNRQGWVGVEAIANRLKVAPDMVREALVLSMEAPVDPTCKAVPSTIKTDKLVLENDLIRRKHPMQKLTLRYAQNRCVLIEHLPTEVTSAAVEAAVRKKFLFYGNILYSKVVSSDLIPPLMSTTPTTSTLHILAHRLRRYPRERRFGIVHYEEPYMASRAAAAMSFPTTSASLGSHALDWRIGKRDKEKDTNNGFASAWLEKVSVSYEPVAEGTTAVTAAPARKMQNHDSIRQESLLMNLDGAYGAMIAERQQQTVGLQIAGGGSKHIQPQQQQQQQQALAFEQAQMQAHAMFFAHAAAAAGMGDYPFPFLPPHAFASNTFHTPQYYPSAFGMQHPLQIQMPQQLPPPQLMPNPSRHPSASAGSGLPALQTVPSGSAAVPAYQQFYQQGLVQQIQTHTQSPPAPNQLDVPRPPLQSSMPALLQQPEVSQMAANQQMTFSLLPSVSTIPINTSRSYAGAASKYLGQMLQPGAEGEGNSDGRAAAATIALNMNLGLGLTAYLMAPTGGFSYREMSSESATDMHEPNRGLRIRRNAAASKQRNIVCDVSENVRGMNLFPAFNSLLSPGLSSEDLVGGDRIPMATLVPYSVLSPLSFHRHTPGMNSPQSPGHAVLAGSPRPHFL